MQSLPVSITFVKSIQFLTDQIFKESAWDKVKSYSTQVFATQVMFLIFVTWLWSKSKSHVYNSSPNIVILMLLWCHVKSSIFKWCSSISSHRVLSCLRCPTHSEECSLSLLPGQQGTLLQFDMDWSCGLTHFQTASCQRCRSLLFDLWHVDSQYCVCLRRQTDGPRPISHRFDLQQAGRWSRVTSDILGIYQDYNELFCACVCTLVFLKPCVCVCVCRSVLFQGAAQQSWSSPHSCHQSPSWTQG